MTSQPTTSVEHVYLITGEPSGDVIGAALMDEMRKIYGGRVRFSGVGGSQMQNRGLNSLFSNEELAVNGLGPVLAKLPSLLGLVTKTADDIIAQQPDVVVTIDSPEFCVRVGRKIRHRIAHVPMVHVGAPTVWVWRPHRAKKWAKIFDLVLALLPFEPEIMHDLGGPHTKYVGHPALDEFNRYTLQRSGDEPPQTLSDAPSNVEASKGSSAVPAQESAEQGTQNNTRPTLLVLPGSRRSEVTNHLPLLEQTLRATIGLERWQLTILTVPSRLEQIKRGTAHWPWEINIVSDEKQKAVTMLNADAAIASSGTVCLELALSATPTIVLYAASPIWTVMNLWYRVRFVALPNVILGREIVPEFTLRRARAELIAPKLSELIAADSVARKQQLFDLQEVKRRLATSGTFAKLACDAIKTAMRR